MWMIYRDTKPQVNKHKMGKTKMSIVFFRNLFKILGQNKVSKKRVDSLFCNFFENYLCLLLVRLSHQTINYN